MSHKPIYTLPTPTRLNYRYSQLVGDSLDESEQICRQPSRVALCRQCERTRRHSAVVVSYFANSVAYTPPTRRNSTVERRRQCVLGYRLFCGVIYVIRYWRCPLLWLQASRWIRALWVNCSSVPSHLTRYLATLDLVLGPDCPKNLKSNLQKDFG